MQASRAGWQRGQCMCSKGGTGRRGVEGRLERAGLRGVWGQAHEGRGKLGQGAGEREARRSWENDTAAAPVCFHALLHTWSVCHPLVAQGQTAWECRALQLCPLDSEAPTHWPACARRLTPFLPPEAHKASPDVRGAHLECQQCWQGHRFRWRGLFTAPRLNGFNHPHSQELSRPA